MIAACVDPQQVQKVWPHVSPWIKSALERGDLGRFEDVERDVLSGCALLWFAYGDKVEAATVTQIGTTERSRVCTILACGGRDVSRWLHLIASIEDYARNERCDCVRILGRRGWRRLLKNYTTTKVVLEKKI